MFNRRLCLKILPALAFAGIFASSTMASAQEGGLWSAVQKAGKLRCATAEAQPYIMKDPATGEYTGYFVELCREFAEVLKVKPEFVDTTWDNVVAGLQAQKWDLAMALTATPQRALAITFSKPVTQTEVSLVYNKSNPKLSEPKSIGDVDKPGITLAVTSGTAQDKLLTEIIKNANIMRLPSADEIRLAVMSKRADVIVDTSSANDVYAAVHSDWAVVLRPAPALNKQGVSFGLRRDTSLADLQALDIFITDLIASGRMDVLIKNAIEQAAK